MFKIITTLTIALVSTLVTAHYLGDSDFVSKKSLPGYTTIKVQSAPTITTLKEKIYEY